MFKRTVLEFIAEEMLESRAAANPPDAPGGVCRITAGATPVVTSPTDSSMQYLYDHLGLGQTDVADIHDISSGLQRLGESAVTFPSRDISLLPCPHCEAAASCAYVCTPTLLWIALLCKSIAELWTQAMKKALLSIADYLLNTGNACTAGYKLERGEAERLLDQVDVGHTGHVAKGQLAASQIDWAALQRDRDHWLRCVRRAFDEFDADHDGVCSLDEIVACLKAKLPLTEVRLLES